MELKDLIFGNYYYCRYKPDYEYIFQAGKIGTNNSDCIEINRNKHLSIKSASFMQPYTFKDLIDLRPATNKEINWLKACEKAGKYVEKPENLVESIEIW